MANSPFTLDAKMSSYWWETTPLAVLPEASLPARADVVVIGGGYTGLNAALQIARGGRHVIVCDAEAIGFGCSTRNGGQISTSIKPDLKTLTHRHGAETAERILQDGRNSLNWIEEFVAEERIDCHFKVVGRFHAAHSTKAFHDLAASAKGASPDEVEIVPRHEQRQEIGSDIYHGGVVYRKHASIDPGRYHAGLLARVTEAEATLAPYTKVTAITRTGKSGIDVQTTRGTIRARDVVLATNGYSGSLSRWHQRRVIPIGSYMIATEEVPTSLIDEINPNNRIVSDTRKVVYYYRSSPDRRRILFGGRVSAAEVDPARSAPLLRDEMVRLFPQLSTTRISHSWMGYVGYTFDTMAHTGSQDGVHHAMGYCGSGVGMASYLGMRTGQRVLGLAEGETGIGQTRFPTRPYYFGKPWFLRPAVSIFRLRDRIGL